LRKTYGEVRSFFEEEIRQRRAAPGEDLISHLIEAQINGQPLSDAHISATLRLLLFAGIDTTWNAIGCCLLHLAAHAADRKKLVTQPQLISTAVEELLRAYSPVTAAREVVKETQINGCHFQEGETVLLAFPAANRDPEKFPHADRVVLERTPNPHVAFGVGIHRCLGARLATMEMTVALQEWLRCIPEFTLAPGVVVEWSKGPVRGPRQVPSVLDAVK
jgi:hypothetical protein